MARVSKGDGITVGSRYSIAVARIVLGLVFLWAFLDKMFGLRFATVPAKAVVNGGAPTKGFLLGVDGPFAPLYHSLAGYAWTDWLFMLGLLGLGIALVFGVGLRIAAVAGTVLLLMLWGASLPLTTNPVIDEHIVFITLLWVIFFNMSNPALSLAGWWRQLVGGNRWLW